MKKITVIFQMEAKARMKKERISHCTLWCRVLDVAHYTIRNIQFPASQAWPSDLEDLRTIYEDFNELFQKYIATCKVIEVQITSGFDKGVGVEFQMFASGHKLIFSFRLYVTVAGNTLFLGCTHHA